MEIAKQSYRYHQLMDPWSSIVGYFLFFFVFRFYVLPGYFPLPKFIFSDKDGAFRQWKWWNISCSLLHSFLSGFLAMTSVYVDNSFHVNMETFESPIIYMLLCMSTGYFFHDVFDYVVTGPPLKDSWDILTHHFVVITSIVISLATKHYYPFLSISLLVEVGTFFMHGLQILRMAKCDPNGTLYKSLSIMTILTYIVFRFGTMGYLTYWAIAYRNDIKPVYYEIIVTGLFSMHVMNTTLFCKLVTRDWLGKGHGKHKN